jgi:hypothetical protein
VLRRSGKRSLAWERRKEGKGRRRREGVKSTETQTSDEARMTGIRTVTRTREQMGMSPEKTLRFLRLIVLHLWFRWRRQACPCPPFAAPKTKRMRNMTLSKILLGREVHR